jgi:flagellar basal-body rod protein FlgB
MTTPVGPFDQSLGALEHAMRVTMLREKAIQTNLANASTPGYQRIDVQFESLLPKEADETAFRAAQPQVKVDKSPGRADGNNVEFDQEYAAMERNRLHYEALVEATSQQIQMLRSAIASK